MLSTDFRIGILKKSYLPLFPIVDKPGRRVFCCVCCLLFPGLLVLSFDLNLQVFTKMFYLDCDEPCCCSLYSSVFTFECVTMSPYQSFHQNQSNFFVYLACLPPSFICQHQNKVDLAICRFHVDSRP